MNLVKNIFLFFQLSLPVHILFSRSLPLDNSLQISISISISITLSLSNSLSLCHCFMFTTLLLLVRLFKFFIIVSTTLPGPFSVSVIASRSPLPSYKRPPTVYITAPVQVFPSLFLWKNLNQDISASLCYCYCLSFLLSPTLPLSLFHSFTCSIEGGD